MTAFGGRWDSVCPLLYEYEPFLFWYLFRPWSYVWNLNPVVAKECRSVFWKLHLPAGTLVSPHVPSSWIDRIQLRSKDTLYNDSLTSQWYSCIIGVAYGLLLLLSPHSSTVPLVLSNGRWPRTSGALIWRVKLPQSSGNFCVLYSNIEAGSYLALYFPKWDTFRQI